MIHAMLPTVFLFLFSSSHRDFLPYITGNPSVSAVHPKFQTKAYVLVASDGFFFWLSNEEAGGVLYAQSSRKFCVVVQKQK